MLGFFVTKKILSCYTDGSTIHQVCCHWFQCSQNLNVKLVIWAGSGLVIKMPVVEPMSNGMLHPITPHYCTLWLKHTMCVTSWLNWCVQAMIVLYHCSKRFYSVLCSFLCFVCKHNKIVLITLYSKKRFCG